MIDCWDLLNQEDQSEYLKLKEKFKLMKCNTRNDQKTKLFQTIIDMIGEYVIRNDVLDRYRAVVTGVIFLGDYHVVNIKQLSIFISRSKTTINQCYAKLGYENVPISVYISKKLAKICPFFKDNFQNRRMWTCRKRVRGKHHNKYWCSMYRLYQNNISNSKQTNANSQPLDDLFFDHFENEMRLLAKKNCASQLEENYDFGAESKSTNYVYDDL